MSSSRRGYRAPMDRQFIKNSKPFKNNKQYGLDELLRSRQQGARRASNGRPHSKGIGSSPTVEQARTVTTNTSTAKPEIRAKTESSCYPGTYVPNIQSMGDVYSILRGDVVWIIVDDDKRVVASLGGLPNGCVEACIANLDKKRKIRVKGVATNPSMSKGRRDKMTLDNQCAVMEHGMHTIVNTGKWAFQIGDLAYGVPDANSVLKDELHPEEGYISAIDIDGIIPEKILLQTIPLQTRDVVTLLLGLQERHRKIVDQVIYTHVKHAAPHGEFSPPDTTQLKSVLSHIVDDLKTEAHARLSGIVDWVQLDALSYACRQMMLKPNKGKWAPCLKVAYVLLANILKEFYRKDLAGDDSLGDQSMIQAFPLNINYSFENHDPDSVMTKTSKLKEHIIHLLDIVDGCKTRLQQYTKEDLENLYIGKVTTSADVGQDMDCLIKASV